MNLPQKMQKMMEMLKMMEMPKMMEMLKMMEMTKMMERTVTMMRKTMETVVSHYINHVYQDIIFDINEQQLFLQ